MYLKDETSIKNAKRETQILLSYKHINVVEMHEAFLYQNDGRNYYVYILELLTPLRAFQAQNCTSAEKMEEFIFSFIIDCAKAVE